MKNEQNLNDFVLNICWVLTSKRLPLQLNWQRIRLQCGRPRFDPWVGKIPWRREGLPNPGFLGFPCGSVGKESTCNAGNLGSVPGLGRYPGEENSYPLQYSDLENSMDCRVHGISQARILEWIAIPFSRDSSQPMDQTQVSCIAGGFFTVWATREAQNILTI